MIERKDREIAKQNGEIVMKDKEIAKQKAENGMMDGEIVKGLNEIAKKDEEIYTKDSEIAKLKRQLQGQVNNVGGNYGNENVGLNEQNVTVQINPSAEITNANNREVAALGERVDHRNL